LVEEVFAKGDSVIHRLDPRIRIIYSLIFSILVAVATGFETGLFGLLLASIIIVLARLSLAKVLQRALIVNAFILFLWFVIPFSYPGRAILTIGPFSASEEGIGYTLLLTVKGNSIILAGIGLLSTIPIFQFTHALDHLKLNHKLIYLFFLIYRYAHIMQLEYSRIRNGLKVRGFKPTTSFFTYKTYGYIIGTLLVRSYERAHRISQAMRLRGFDGHFWVLDHFKMKKVDKIEIIVLSSSLVLLCLTVIL